MHNYIAHSDVRIGAACIIIDTASPIWLLVGL